MQDGGDVWAQVLLSIYPSLQRLSAELFPFPPPPPNLPAQSRPGARGWIQP